MTERTEDAAEQRTKQELRSVGIDGPFRTPAPRGRIFYRDAVAGSTFFQRKEQQWMP